MNKFQKKILFDLGISFLILTALGAGIIFFSSNLKTFTSKSKETRKEIEKRSDIVGGLAKLRKQESDFGTAYLNVLYNYIPSEDELINFENKLQAIASREGVGFGFSYLGEVKESANALNSVRFTLNLQAPSQERIINVIRRLQDFQNLVKIESFSISGKSGEAKGLVRALVFFRS